MSNTKNSTTQTSHSSFAWEILEESMAYRANMFDLYSIKMRSHNTNYEGNFDVVKSANWVNIIPVTTDGEVVMIRQYRFGINKVSLEIPGGIIDPEDEDPKVAAIRELKEETGYSSSKIIELGSVCPNPAIQNNSCYHFVAYDVNICSEQQLDKAEEISVHLFPLNSIHDLIRKGEIVHALVISAFHLLSLRS